MKVLFFVQIRSFTACDQIDLVVTEPINARQLWAELERRFPRIETFKSSTRLACNSAYVNADHTFHPGDEVALLSPVSGG
ncbi:MAG: MoaD/ThiS family protein [Verrucomicrobiota bacterium]|nr:MoaD/ThiS family protein [Verrucomicrobiota bacterium]